MYGDMYLYLFPGKLNITEVMVLYPTNYENFRNSVKYIKFNKQGEYLKIVHLHLCYIPIFLGLDISPLATILIYLVGQTYQQLCLKKGLYVIFRQDFNDFDICYVA